MNGPISLLHVVGREKVSHTSQPVKQIVFETEHGRRSNNGSLGEDLARNFLSPALFT